MWWKASAAALPPWTRNCGVRLLPLDFRDQYFGCEIERTGINRATAAHALANLFGTRAEHSGGGYDAYRVKDLDGKEWKIVRDSSIHPESQLDCYEGYPTFYDKETVTVTDADGAPHEIMVYTMNTPYRDQLLPVSSRYNAVVLQGCLDAGISPQQFYDADEKYRKAYKARAAPVPKKHAPER